ncbi:MAG: sulfotransferase family protein [bacterium]|nr:sulfotransferase family protein [Deltaproteobacteria bacterium]MCP4904891.1 sulfotransferase family protein [bacterium]
MSEEGLRTGAGRPKIVVVSGLPRSGTSMMMQMLEAAGLSLLTDGARPPDPDNPLGYFEFEPVRKLPTDASFLAEAVGRVIKVVAPLLFLLPSDYEYFVVLIERELDEVLASQHEMLARLGERTSAEQEAALRAAFEGSLRAARDWIAREEGVRACFVSHATIVESPERAARDVLRFLEVNSNLASGLVRGGAGDGGEEEIVERMISVFDDSLYRQRGTKAT